MTKKDLNNLCTFDLRSRGLKVKWENRGAGPQPIIVSWVVGAWFALQGGGRRSGLISLLSLPLVLHGECLLRSPRDYRDTCQGRVSESFGWRQRSPNSLELFACRATWRPTTPRRTPGRPGGRPLCPLNKWFGDSIWPRAQLKPPGGVVPGGSRAGAPPSWGFKFGALPLWCPCWCGCVLCCPPSLASGCGGPGGAVSRVQHCGPCPSLSRGEGAPAGACGF